MKFRSALILSARALSAATASLLILCGAACAATPTDPDLKALKDLYSPDLRDGINALHKHDYAAALAKFRPLADQGNATAQLMLGNMYRYGNGLPHDDAQGFD